MPSSRTAPGAGAPRAVRSQELAPRAWGSGGRRAPRPRVALSGGSIGPREPSEATGETQRASGSLLCLHSQFFRAPPRNGDCPE